MFKGLVLTYNEEISIEDCIKSLLPVCDQIIVVDSYSTDRTVDIAYNYGCTVVLNEFKGFASQRKFAISLFEYGSFVLMLDSDERLPADSYTELLNIIESEKYNGIYMRRRDFYMGNWIKRSSSYPLLFMRGFRVGYLDISREVNEIYKVTGSSYVCKADLVHYPLIKGEAFWIEKHLKYAQLEAIEIISKKKNLSNSLRHRVKYFLYQNPTFKILLLFLYYYFFRFCFLDGKSGRIYIRGKILYERMINYYLAVLKKNYI